MLLIMKGFLFLLLKVLASLLVEDHSSVNTTTSILSNPLR